MNAQITLETQDLDELTNEIRDRILEFNQERAGPFNDVRVVLTARAESGELIGGLVGLGFWNGLFIELLWIDEAVRGQGFPEHPYLSGARVLPTPGLRSVRRAEGNAAGPFAHLVRELAVAASQE